ncbi:MAG: asparagine synthetase B family protein [Catonella sp.]|uniref:asparagine synthetase B family protein n=1 Tax=Catonella sp. TaxID=2382125 RepID=UPI003FA09C32
MVEIREYKGHIRNHKALCKELGLAENLGREERENLILIKAYEKWGMEMLNHLYGMFAFAIVDGDKIILVRDHFGAKPFYYYKTADERLIYGTQIRKIMEDTAFVKEFNLPLLQIYLSLTYTPGDETFFKGVKKLMPGHFLVWENGKMNISRYYKYEMDIDNTKTIEEFSEEIHSMVTQIFTEIKDEGEEAASFLSGGVDSSYVLAMSDAKISASCGYEDERFDESYLAKETSKILNRENMTSIISPEEYFDIVPFVMENMEQPLADASAIAFALGCKAVAKKTKLCYSGEGADEFFGGYNMYRNAERYGDNLKDFYVGNTNIMKEDEKKAILKVYDENNLPINYVKDLYEEMEGLDPLSKMSLVDISVWLEGDIYLNVDKMSTAAGLEIRMPLTDRRIFDIARKMPPQFKVNETQNKVAFRNAAVKVLPEDIAYRKKLGFIVPIRIWLADERYNKDVVRLFNSEIAEKFFDVKAINAIFEDYIGGNSDNWRKIWTIYTFLLWYSVYFAQK